MGEGRDPWLPSHKKAPRAAGDAIGWLGLGQRGGAFAKSAPGLQPGAISIPLRELTGSFLGLTGNETTLRVVPDRSGKTWNR